MKVGGGRIATSLVSSSGMGPVLNAVYAVLRKQPAGQAPPPAAAAAAAAAAGAAGAAAAHADMAAAGAYQAKRLAVLVQKLALCVGTGHISEERLTERLSTPIEQVCYECIDKAQRVESAASLRSTRAALYASGLVQGSMSALNGMLGKKGDRKKKKKEAPPSDPRDPRHEKLIGPTQRLGERLVDLVEPHLSCRSISELDAFFDFITSFAFIEHFFTAEAVRPEREAIIAAMSESYNYY